ncbi:MAG: chemotaxis protein CheW [Candidatus Cyclonatronum sp.]|uniref:chemotaxis protein CheW n=1 Tax=Cyclonatronum sp. TaxID=3024185 RepID=UPI0025BD3FAA|nr:chemotaxis protein CheW [Cyclonatronum sp.]MCH8485985.1 chemotaxis protein CheW [Cyclonatronum sp.]
MYLKNNQYFTFTVEDQRLALKVEEVEKVIHAVYVTPIPDSPVEIEGVFEYHQLLVPVLNLRKRFGATAKPLEVQDVFILVKQRDGTLLALLADTVEGVLEKKGLTKADTEADLAALSEVHLERAKVMRDDSGILLLYRAEQLLTERLQHYLEGLMEKYSES